MEKPANSIHSNLFEIDNAKNLSKKQVVNTFVPMQSFWRLMSAKNHVLIGSRGSGKTQVAKMLSHDHLCCLDDERAKKIIECKSIIGTYVPTKLDWVSKFKNKIWMTEEQKAEFFSWRLNLFTCLSFIDTIESCLNCYISDAGEKAQKEKKICMNLTKDWLDSNDCFTTLSELKQHLEDIEFYKQKEIERERVLSRRLNTDNSESIGLTFGLELFAPFKRGIRLISRIMGFSNETIWLLCLDEAELLSKDQIEIINSHLRAHSDNIFFKITTTPYSFVQSTDIAVPLDAGHDFDYIYLDNDSIFENARKDSNKCNFARNIFSKRASESGPRFSGLNMNSIFGESELLDDKNSDWLPNSYQMMLLQQFGNDKTKARAKKLISNPSKFKNEISRKINGALILKNKVNTLSGNDKFDAYSGVSMVIRCSDMNPRQLIKIYNLMLLNISNRRDFNQSKKSISPQKQTETLIKISTHKFNSTISEPQCGTMLKEFIEQVGNYMKFCLHSIKLSTDQITSVKINTDIEDEQWFLIERAVSMGLLYPNINPNNPDELPYKSGVFHLAYSLSPYFRILPRRGKSRDLKNILQGDYSSDSDVFQPSLFDASIKE